MNLDHHGATTMLVNDPHTCTLGHATQNVKRLAVNVVTFTLYHHCCGAVVIRVRFSPGPHLYFSSLRLFLCLALLNIRVKLIFCSWLCLVSSSKKQITQFINFAGFISCTFLLSPIIFLAFWINNFILARCAGFFICSFAG